MKFLYLANMRLPTEKAHGVQSMKMCEAFARALNARGMVLELVVPNRRTHITDDPFLFYNVERCFSIKRMPCLDVVWLGRVGFYIQSITFYFFALCYAVQVHAVRVYTRDMWPALFLKNCARELHTITAHSRGLQRWSWRRARWIIAMTHGMREQLLHRGVLADKIIVAHDGVDAAALSLHISHEAAREIIGAPREKKIIGYVGMLKTMNREKGIDIACEALRLLPQDVMLMIVGGAAKDIAEYRALTERLGIASRVWFVGMVPHGHVPTYLAACDVLIAPFPSQEHYRLYMSPLKVFEYLSSERPVVVSDLPSLREVVNDEIASVIPPGDVPALAAALMNVFKNPELFNERAQQARRAMQAYTWDARAAHILRFIGVLT